MRTHASRALAAALAAGACIATTSALHAGDNVQPVLRLPRGVVAGGGGDARGDGWRLVGTIGQAVVGDSRHGGYRLRAGFDPRPRRAAATIFRNGFEDLP